MASVKHDWERWEVMVCAQHLPARLDATEKELEYRRCYRASCHITTESNIKMGSVCVICGNISGKCQFSTGLLNIQCYKL